MVLASYFGVFFIIVLWNWSQAIYAKFWFSMRHHGLGGSGAWAMMMGSEDLNKPLPGRAKPRGLVELSASDEGAVVVRAWLPAVKGGFGRLKRSDRYLQSKPRKVDRELSPPLVAVT